MSEVAALIAEKRSNLGKKYTKLLRKENKVPATIYSGDYIDHISFDKIEMKKAIYSGGFTSRINTVLIGKKKNLAVVKEIQVHPVSNEVLHVDFLKLESNSEVALEIPVKVIGQDKSKGIKRGGVLNIVHPKIKLLCKVDKVVDSITIDISDMGINTGVRIKDIKLSDGIKQKFYDENETIVTVNAPKGSGITDDEENNDNEE